MISRRAAVAAATVATAMTIVLACDHSKASPTVPMPTSTEQPTDTTNQPAGAGQPAGDERQIHPVDARVISLTHEQGKLEIVIGLSRETDPGLVHSDWIGMFIADGKEISGSNFKLKRVWGREVRAEIVADQLPSETVRLFPPGYRGRF